MKLFFVFFLILLIFFIPIPIKFNIYYSPINYYIKLYGITIISKKKFASKENAYRKVKPPLGKKHKFLSSSYKKVDFKALMSTLYSSKFKPLLNIKLSLDYSLNDAAKTAIFYGVLCQLPPLIYVLLNVPFKTKKFNFKISPIFEDKFSLKFETSSIVFLSFANIIYIIIILFRYIKKSKGGDPLGI